MDPEEAGCLYREYFETIGDMAASASRHFSAIEAEEFDIFVKDRLFEDDYRRIRAYEGRNGASFKTFLATVISNLLKDFRDRIWGKVRPTEKAKKRGPSAVLLERLLRERHSFEEVFEIMTTNHRIPLTRREFEELTQHVNLRFRPRIEARELPASFDRARTPEEAAIHNQMLDQYCRLLQQLRRFCQDLETEDALILKFRFEDGRMAGEIEDLLGRKRDRPRGKALFRRIEHLASQLRRSLETAGFSARDVRAFLENPGLGDGCDDLAAGENA
jgi:hypothetical protein